jgi:hypothetical protein
MQLVAKEPGVTYQGRVTNLGVATSGAYDLRFALFDAPTEGVQIGPAITNGAVVVREGTFSVRLQFDSTLFNGEDRWLELQVRTNGAAAFTLLNPRQELTGSPYAHYAATAGHVGPAGVNGASLARHSVTGDKVAPGTLRPENLDLGTFDTTFWQLGGNAGTTPGRDFLGTTDHQPLELKVNGVRGLRLQPHGTSPPSMVAGYQDNTIAVGAPGSVIAGGTSNRNEGSHFSITGGGIGNVFESGGGVSVIAGGEDNVVGGNATAAVIAGGSHNTVGPGTDGATIGGGRAQPAWDQRELDGHRWRIREYDRGSCPGQCDRGRCPERHSNECTKRSHCGWSGE